jgi:formylglycine-generating enzyme required for sulfatase activity
MAGENQLRVFVSHSHQDNVYCRDYVAGLRARNCDVWYDEYNLGWGALRATIEREMPKRQHFVAILSTAASGSEWVNTEIDAAIELLNEGKLQTLTFVVAEQCDVPLLLRRWKRIEGPRGAAVSVEEAVTKTLAIITSGGSGVYGASPSGQTMPPQPVSRYPLPDVQERLAQLGFRGVNLIGSPAIVPPLCQAPGGPFTMGSDPARDPAANADEQPQHRVEVPYFQIARYPVTVAEYALAVRSGGVPEPSATGGQTWQAQLQRPDYPVVCVTWLNARAYARWLSTVTQKPWRLANEAQWEKAARWDYAQRVSRLYPWGDSFDRARCNTRDNGAGRTLPVGSFPASDRERSGASPCGAEDMIGNVWEWTDSLYRPYPFKAADDPTADATDHRTMRGASWLDDRKDARASFRFFNRAENNGDLIGFRLVC